MWGKGWENERGITSGEDENLITLQCQGRKRESQAQVENDQVEELDIYNRIEKTGLAGWLDGWKVAKMYG